MSHLNDASKQYGFNNFVVAAKVDLIRTRVARNESLACLLLDVDSKKKEKADDDCNESLARLVLDTNSETEAVSLPVQCS